VRVLRSAAIWAISQIAKMCFWSGIAMVRMMVSLGGSNPWAQELSSPKTAGSVKTGVAINSMRFVSPITTGLAPGESARLTGGKPADIVVDPGVLPPGAAIFSCCHSEE
jgi:hypothetical protein